jgi:hypothetical protein
LEDFLSRALFLFEILEQDPGAGESIKDSEAIRRRGGWPDGGGGEGELRGLDRAGAPIHPSPRISRAKARARRRLLAFASNEVERKVWEILIRQKASARGSRRGNRESINTRLKDGKILNAHADWQKGRAKLGSDRQFAEWWIEREEHKDATEADIKRITKRLRDARQRSGTLIAPIATVDQSQYVRAGLGAAEADIKRLRDARQRSGTLIAPIDVPEH